MRKFWIAAASFVGGVALLGAAQGTSQAAEPTQSSVPDCVTFHNYGGPLGNPWAIVNGCDTTQSVRPLWGVFETPGACYTLAPGESVEGSATDLTYIRDLVPC